MKVVFLFAEKWNMNPFDVLKQDVDDFIEIANYFIRSNDKVETKTEKEPTPAKVYDNFWDF